MIEEFTETTFLSKIHKNFKTSNLSTYPIDCEITYYDYDHNEFNTFVRNCCNKNPLMVC